MLSCVLYGSKKHSLTVFFIFIYEKPSVHNNLKNNKVPAFQISKAFLNLLKRENKKDG